MDLSVATKLATVIPASFTKANTTVVTTTEVIITSATTTTAN